MFSTDEQMGCQCFMNFFHLRDPQIVLKKAEEHSRHINNIQTSVDLTMFISASEDNTARLFDSASLDHIKTLKTERPLNSAAISLVTCLWEEAMGVTTAFTRIGKFEARFFQAVYQEEFGRSQRSFWSHQLCGFLP
ncbi:eukaryotic translation initiation factor 3 subunit I-like isoform X2 [Cynoglossus semilaevis]|uniref:eukaryotic translation initiation factor 3 subunit I-like isoform X2 n=1 Tax=Cynoglossus semilaevis TaxID=244447 RepID=UPI0004952E34|nr:eukaryotic translation initiation factor 3 subunit I-like isoform X2 [Cynoglossus semilaevis]XP_024909718.1 eukaryotic translation initiation factor 3 subunit I-like isoform X2 [Cynoglossus semilaevis]